MGNEDEEFQWEPIVTNEEKEMMIEAANGTVDECLSYFCEMRNIWFRFIELNKRFQEDDEYAESCHMRAPALLAIANTASRDYAIHQYVDINHDIEGEYY